MDAQKKQQFSELFHAEYEKMCRYAFSYLKDEQSAEDVVQETFVKLWEQKQELLGLDNMRYYLVASVRNNCISYLRKQKGTTELNEATQEIETVMGSIKSIENETQREQLEKIKKALEQLPPKCREVFLLIKMQGMSYKQCADTLGLSVKTIENQMTKAIKIFKVGKETTLLIGILMAVNLTQIAR